MPNKQLIFILIIVCYALTIVLQTPYLATLSIGIFIYSLNLFIEKLGKSIPLKELAFLVATIQLLLSSYLAFYIQEPDKVFLPKTPPFFYFKYAIPGVLLFFMGLNVFKSEITYKDIEFNLHQYDSIKIAKQLIGIGYLGIFISPFMPGGLSYFFTLLSFLSYIGGIILIINSFNKETLPWIIIAFLPVVRDAFFSGVFYLALIWLVFSFLYYMILKSHYSFAKKAAIIILGLYLTITLDSAKKGYREVVWNKNKETFSFADRSALMGTLIFEHLTFQNLTNEQNVSARITRANQGALVTWVMDYVPEKEPYANGITIKESVIAAIFPRFLMPNKAIAGGKENFEKYTGHKLKNTSMNISLLGEGWANYGYWGGLVFMFAIGVFYSFSLKKFIDLIHQYPIYFYFIPFLFIYVIKAEDDLLTPLNHIFKASLVLVILHYTYIRKLSRINE